MVYSRTLVPTTALGGPVATGAGACGSRGGCASVHGLSATGGHCDCHPPVFPGQSCAPSDRGLPEHVRDNSMITDVKENWHPDGGGCVANVTCTSGGDPWCSEAQAAVDREVDPVLRHHGDRLCTAVCNDPTQAGGVYTYGEMVGVVYRFEFANAEVSSGTCRPWFTCRCGGGEARKDVQLPDPFPAEQPLANVDGCSGPVGSPCTPPRAYRVSNQNLRLPACSEGPGGGGPIDATITPGVREGPVEPSGCSWETDPEAAWPCAGVTADAPPLNCCPLPSRARSSVPFWTDEAMEDARTGFALDTDHDCNRGEDPANPTVDEAERAIARAFALLRANSDVVNWIGCALGNAALGDAFEAVVMNRRQLITFILTKTSATVRGAPPGTPPTLVHGGRSNIDDLTVYLGCERVLTRAGARSAEEERFDPSLFKAVAEWTTESTMGSTSRRFSTTVPLAATILHELGHSYFGREPLPAGSDRDVWDTCGEEYVPSIPTAGCSPSCRAERLFKTLVAPRYA